MTQLATGDHALIRDKEWLIRLVDPSADGGWLFTCYGISDLVRGAIGAVPQCTRRRYRNPRTGPNPANAQRHPKKCNATLRYQEGQQSRNMPKETHIDTGHQM